MEYKSVRITAEYLEKLRSISSTDKRTMAKTLEVLIDTALYEKTVKPALKAFKSPLRKAKEK